MGNTRVTQFGVKSETVQGTPVALAATDFMPCRVIDITPTVELIEQDYLRAAIGELEHLTGKKFLDIQIETPDKWSGIAGTPYAPLAALIQAAATLQTVNAGAEAVGAASPNSGNLGTSPAPVLTIAAPDFKAVSGQFILRLLSKVVTGGSEAAEFEIEFKPNDGSASEFATFSVTGAAFANVAANEAGDLQDHIDLTVNDPNGGGAGQPVTVWHVGDSWTFSYTSAVQVNVTYAPTSEKLSANFYGPGKSVSVQFYFESTTGAQLYKGKGALVSNASLMAKAGGLGTWSFTLRGLFDGEATDEGGFATEDHGEVLPAIMQSATITVQSVAICIENFKFSIENNLTERVCASAVAGLMGFQIASRAVKVEFDPELLSVASHPFVARLKAGTSMAFSAAWTIESNGSTPQKRTIAGSKLQYDGIKPADRNGIRIVQATARFKDSPNSNDSFSMVYASA